MVVDETFEPEDCTASVSVSSPEEKSVSKKFRIDTKPRLDFALAADSVTAATQAVALFSKLRKVKLNTDAKDSDHWYYEPEEGFHDRVSLKLDQPYREQKPEPKSKALALPAPKRGTILCICEKSYVAPRQSCVHCGRPFSESHNRTHDTHDTHDTQSKLRLI
jgi:hypothetical protein